MTNILACGGDLTSEEGHFASPGYPGNYPDSAECTWKIGGAPGNKVRVTFLRFDVEESAGCNRDFVEIHKDSEEGELLGHYCGSNLPVATMDEETQMINNNITSGTAVEAETLWIKFNSDGSGTRSGFTAYYNLSTILQVL